MIKKFENMKGRKIRMIFYFVFAIIVFGLLIPYVSYAANTRTVAGVTLTEVSGGVKNVWTGSDGKRYRDSNPGGRMGGFYELDGDGNMKDGATVLSYVTSDNGTVLEEKKTDNVVLPGSTSTRSTSEDFSDISIILGNILGWIIYYIAVAAGWIVSALVYAMLSVMSYPINTHLPAISSGWTAVRDMCNNFFIILLIAIAIGTIIKIPQWQIKALLPKLLVMAILINFSKMFCGIMIDVSQIFMLAFASPLQGITGGNIILSALGIPDMYKLMDPSGSGGWTDSGAATLASENKIGYINIITALVYALIASVVAAAVMVAIIIILIYRIVALLFLTVLSPLPFLLTTFKQGEKYAGQWWSQMTSNLIVGPIMLFFLWLAFSIMGYSGATTNNSNGDTVYNGNAIQNKSGQTDKKNNSDLKLPEQEQFATLSEAMSTKGIINFGLVIGMLVAALVMGKSTGAAGASWAGSSLSFLDKARKGAQAMPWRATRNVAGAIGTGINDRMLIGEGLARTGFKIANKVPLVRTLLSRPFARMTATMKSARTKRNEETIRNAELVEKKAFRDKNAEELVEIAENGNIDQRMAVTRELIRRVVANPNVDSKLEARALAATKDLFANTTTFKGGNSKLLGDLKDEFASRHQARGLEVLSKEELRKLIMAGKYDPDKAARKISSFHPDWLQKLFDAFITEDDIAVYEKAGKKADINSYIRYQYANHDGDPKLLAASLSQFQDEGIKEIIRGQMDYDQLRDLFLSISNKDGIIDKDNALTIGGSLLKNRLVGTEKISDLFHDSSSGQPMKEENRDIMADLVTQNAGDIAARIKERISMVKELKKSGKNTEADNLNDEIQAQMADIYENVSDVCGASTMKVIRGAIEDQKVLSRKAFVDAVGNRAQNLDNYRNSERKKYFSQAVNAGKTEADFQKDFLDSDSEYKRLTDNFGLGGEHVGTGSTKVDLIGMQARLAKIRDDAKAKGDINAQANYDANMKVLEDKMVKSFIGGLSVADFGSVQMGPAPTSGPDKDSMASALKLVQAFTLRANGAKLYNYRRSATKHKSNEAATNLLWNTVGKFSGGKLSKDFDLKNAADVAQLDKIREEIMASFKIKKGMYGYVDSGDIKYLQNIKDMLKTIQENPEVWDNFKP